eukprot:m.73616 g.73616  ORF g.73616 m.73616 type:complete len:52 (-) comp24580_c0_seq1:260-415(-)
MTALSIAIDGPFAGRGPFPGGGPFDAPNELKTFDSGIATEGGIGLVGSCPF